MRGKMFKVVGGIGLTVSCLLILYMAMGMLQGGRFDMSGVIGSGLIIGVPMIVGTIFMVCGLSEERQRRRFVTGVEWVVFAAYLIILTSILFLGQRGSIAFSETRLQDYIARNCNFMPLRTIREYIRFYQEDTINTSIIVENLLGNLMLFMPMGVFLPALFKKVKTWGRFVGITLLIIYVIEIAQVLTRTGSYDIDDVILNLGGACVVFAIVKGKVVTGFLQKIYILENDKVEKVKVTQAPTASK
ncbi:MAG: VanZ family protein [bacterium]|nr:VanZ family protein [bacterium]